MGRRGRGAAAPIEELIPLAVRQEKIVAIAILMERKGISAGRARSILNSSPKLKGALARSRKRHLIYDHGEFPNPDNPAKG